MFALEIGNDLGFIGVFSSPFIFIENSEESRMKILREFVGRILVGDIV